MTPHDLLNAFETLADTPDGIERLRDLVLQLAVRGKLVPQDPGDEPASELLKRIAAEKQRLYEAGEIRKPKELPPIEDDEVPYELPEGWEWVRLGDVCRIQTGKLDANAASDDGDYMFFTCARHPLRIDHYAYDDECVLLAGNGNFDVNYYSGKFEAYQRTYIIRPPERSLLSVRFLYRFFQLYSAHLREQAIGGVIKYIKVGFLTDALFAVPPLAEQSRIVERVDELMELLDRLEEAQDARNSTRERLRDSALAELREADSAEEVEVAWERVSQEMHDLFTKPEDVQPLRDTILQLAVRGKLVPQDPDDEPASELIERIKAEKQRLYEAGEIRKPKDLPPVAANDVPYELPDGWEWGGFRTIGRYASGAGFPKKYQGHLEKPFMFCKVSDMNRDGNEREITSTANYIDEQIANATRATLHPAGTVVFPKIGGAIATNKRRLLVSPTAIDNNCAGVTPADGVEPRWVLRVLESIDLSVYQSGSSVPALNYGILDSILFGVPPMLEQVRIVEHVDELMSMCDALEASLTAAQELRERFAESAVSGLEV